jgi:hypothetical protein
MMENLEHESQSHYHTGANVLEVLSSFCLGWSYSEFVPAFKDTEKGADYYWELFTKVRMTFPETGADMLGFIYELDSEEKTHLFKHLFGRDVKF